MSFHREDWQALGNSVVDWANAHPGLVRSVVLFVAGFILGILF